MPKFERAFLAVRFATHNDKRSHEADDLEVSTQFLSIPDLPILSFESSTLTRLGVDLGDALTAIRFGFVGHAFLLDDGVRSFQENGRNRYFMRAAEGRATGRGSTQECKMVMMSWTPSPLPATKCRARQWAKMLFGPTN